MTPLDKLLAGIQYNRQEWPFGVQVRGELRLVAGVSLQHIVFDPRSIAAENAYARAQIRQDIADSLYGDLRRKLQVIERGLRYWDGRDYPISLVMELKDLIDGLSPSPPLVAEDPDKRVVIPPRDAKTPMETEEPQP